MNRTERNAVLTGWSASIRGRIAGWILGERLWQAMFRSLPCPHGCGKQIGDHAAERQETGGNDG